MATNPNKLGRASIKAMSAENLNQWALRLVGLIIVTTLTLVMAARLTNYGVLKLDQSQAVKVRAVVFEERDDGRLAIYDVGAKTPFEVIEPEARGFIRGTLRALKQFRRVNRANPDIPFELVRWADGRFSLRDAADGREIALEAFGPSNAAEFERVLGLKGVSQ